MTNSSEKRGQLGDYVLGNAASLKYSLAWVAAHVLVKGRTAIDGLSGRVRGAFGGSGDTSALGRAAMR